MSTDAGISEQVTIPSKHIEVNGAKMHYLEMGEGKPILFLHSIPMSSYSWRNVIPHVASLGRCIAPDLIGFGQSEKPDIEYSVFDHIKFIDAFIEKMGLKNITIVMHGWGSVIGFDYAMRNEKNCAGLIFYEAFLRSASGNDLSLPYQEQLVSLQGEDDACELTASGSGFVDYFMPQAIMRQLTNSELNNYREPFTQPGSGKPIKKYLDELPNGNQSSKVDELIDNYSKKLTQSQLPKLMLYSVPGFIITIATAIWAKENLPKLEIIDIGEELHLAQEACPQLMGETISVWLQGVEQIDG